MRRLAWFVTVLAAWSWFSSHVATAGDLFVSEWYFGCVYQYTPSGTQSTFASGLNSANGLAFDAGGNLFVADSRSNIIYKFTPSGSRSTFASGLSWPKALAFDGNGNLFEVDMSSGNIYKFTPSGSRSTFASGLKFPTALAFDGNGNLFVGERDSGTVHKFTSSGARSTFASGLNSPAGLAFDGSGNLFETDFGSGNIYKFTPSGSRSTFASGLNGPTALAFDGDGNLFEADSLNLTNNIYKFTPSGSRSTFASGLNSPVGLAFAPTVPEPSTFALLGMGAVGLMAFAWRRRKRLLQYTPLGAAVLLVLVAGVAHAVNIETVPVGNTGNAGEWSGESYGGVGPNRLCGAVNYAYNIGKYEVTAGQYTAFLNAVGGVDTYALYYVPDMANTTYGCGIARTGSGTVSIPYTYTVAASFVNRPVNFVDYWCACRFANWLHNGQPTGAQGPGTTETGAYTLTSTAISRNTVVRNTDWKWAVTSEDEWYKAAYHKNNGNTGDYFDYPTRSNTPPGRDLADPLPGNNANINGSPSPISAGKHTTVVGEFQNSASPYGTFDQGGNVEEWNETITGSYRAVRGGAFDRESNRLLASGRAPYAYPLQEWSDVGFRVVSAVPEPGSLAMLAGIALTALLYWWRKHV